MQRAVQQVLNHHYGHQWDKPNECRRFTHQENSFCMKLMRMERVELEKRQYLYVMTAGEAYNQDGVLGDNGHAQEGLGGLFLLTKTPQGWRTVAATRAIPTGQWGIPQIDQLKLTQIGAKRWGWVGRMGGSGAGGESNEQWLVYAPIGQSVVEVANLDSEHYYAGSESMQETSTQFSWDKTVPMDAGFYRVRWFRQTTTAPIDAASFEPILSQSKTTKAQGVARFNQVMQRFE